MTPAYPEEFRREAVQLLLAGRTPRELSESHGVSQQTLRNWRRQAQHDRGERDGGGLTTDEREELRRLRREVVRFRTERDVFKRATAFFARRPRPGDDLPAHLGREGPRQTSARTLPRERSTHYSIFSPNAPDTGRGLVATDSSPPARSRAHTQ